MRKRILLILTVLAFAMANTYGQNIVGGAGVIHVDADPNTIATLNTMSPTEGHVAYDTTDQIVYFYDQAQAIGSRWIAVDITDLTNPIQSVTAAPGETELIVNTDADGNVTIEVESGASITFNNTNNTLTFTDIDGDAGTPIDISGATDLADGDGTTIAGTGTAADPYTVDLEGFATATDGQVLTVNSTGGVDWEALVQSASFTANGELQLTLSDGSTVLVNMENIPSVANMTELNTAAGAVDSTSGGVARAAATNTFGLPADSNVGVLFFISN